MTRSSFPIAEGLAVVGIGFGTWLLHQAFNAAVDTPSLVLVFLGGLDILICWAALGYLLRQRLQDGQRLPKSWIVMSVVLIAGLLGWSTALLLNAESLRADIHFRQQAMQKLTPIEEAVRQMQPMLPPATATIDRGRWNLVHEAYLVAYHPMIMLLRDKPALEHQLTQLDEQVAHLNKLATAAVWDPHNDSLITRDRAQTLIEKLRLDISHGEESLPMMLRTRWHHVGATALSATFLLFGCVLMWIIFDRELRRRRKAQQRLAESEQLYRSLTEQQSDPLAVVNTSANILFASPQWQTAFGYNQDDLIDRNCLELIHPEDRAKVQLAFEKHQFSESIPCRLSADYGIWHDVELQWQAHDAEGTTAVRLRNLRETGEKAVAERKIPDPVAGHDIPLLVYVYDSAARRFTSVNHLPLQALGYTEPHAANAADVLLSLIHPEDQARVFGPFARNDMVVTDEIRLRDAAGQYQWFGVQHHSKASNVIGAAFPIQRQKNAEESLAQAERKLQALTQTEAQARADLQQLHQHKTANEAAVREHEHRRKHLEKTLHEREEHCSKLEEHAKSRERHHEELQASLRDHQARLHDREEHCRKLEQHAKSRDKHHEELQASLRDHQARLHRHAGTVQAGKEAMWRLASGVANDFNKILSVVLGYTDVLRESFAKDHLAQNYVEEIRQAASHGTELAQKLLAFSRNHLLQLVPVELNHQLETLQAKIGATLGSDVQWQWDRSKDELWVKTDPHPLEQALLNTLAHVRQNLAHGGVLHMSTSLITLTKKEVPHTDMDEGKYVQIRLHFPNGELDENTRKHLFEPYYPVKEGHKTDLSLATANGIIRQSGGSIEVESQPEQGSTLSILLPATDERPQPAAVAA